MNCSYCQNKINPKQILNCSHGLYVPVCKSCGEEIKYQKKIWWRLLEGIFEACLLIGSAVVIYRITSTLILTGVLIIALMVFAQYLENILYLKLFKEFDIE